MKKIIPVLLALLLLSACVRTPLPPAAPEPTQEAEAAPTNALPEEDDEMKKGTVTLDGLNSYLRLTLPEGWMQTEAEDSVADRCILLLDSEAEDSLQLLGGDGFRIELCWWSSFGMCGTGVDFREIELKRLGKATLAVEEGAEKVWWTLILPAQPDQFTLQIWATQAQIDAHQAEIQQILDSLQIGTLAQIPPQPTQQLADR